jgi:heat shock protein HtpX
MYDLIAANKRNSLLLIASIMILVIVVGGVIGAAVGGPPEFGVAIAAAVAVVMFLTSWFGGRGVILAFSGAKKIEHGDNPQLDNVVEEMAIAAGLPKPDIYLIDDTAPNAFATGRDPKHAAVAITTGLLEKLDRDELQGVIAHELSHVRNFDIRFAMLMAVMVGTIALLCDFFLRYTWYGGGRRRSRSSSSSEGKGGGAQAVLLVLALVLAILAPIVAKLIQLAVSREREYLADASAAEMTRFPDALARALKKISGDKEVLEVANRATQHLYIINPIKSFEARSKGLFSTHPPTEERIARLQSIAAASAPDGA